MCVRHVNCSAHTRLKLVKGTDTFKVEWCISCKHADEYPEITNIKTLPNALRQVVKTSMANNKTPTQIYYDMMDACLAQNLHKEHTVLDQQGR